ncbi:MAG: RadC family protein [Alphaproteobacteria bacterium]|nr:RadC family protein [Alphaproteobacteria bacterium]
MSDDNELFHVGHRERLRQKFQDGKLADYEKLELLLTYSIPRRDVRPLARALAKHFGGVYYVFTAPMEELLKFKGLGRSSAILIKLNQELVSLNYRKSLEDEKVFYDHQTLINYLRWEMSGLDHEELHIYYLGNNFRVIKQEIHSKGSIDEAPIYPREIIKNALYLNSQSIILVHNHPTTDNTFSTADIVQTEQLIEMASVHGIQVYDHFVVAGGIVHSMRGECFLNRSKSINK